MLRDLFEQWWVMYGDDAYIHVTPARLCAQVVFTISPGAGGWRRPCAGSPQRCSARYIPFPNIDVVFSGGRLPFKDATFDAIVCENVIEHVPNPFDLASEIGRVLAPNGLLGINGTNLHFTHGFPSHYFNPTEFGMRHLFDADFNGDYYFPDAPDSLHTILAYYINALDADARNKVRAMSLGELMDGIEQKEPAKMAALSALSDKAKRAISTNVYFVGRKSTSKPSAWQKIRSHWWRG